MLYTILFSWNLIIKKFRTHSLMALQTSISILLLVFLVSRMQFIDHTSNISNTFNGQNAFYFMPYKYLDDSFHIEDTLAKTTTPVESIGEIGNLFFKDDYSNVVAAYGYSDTMIDLCNLSLSDGAWFAGATTDLGSVPAIAVGDLYSIGDVIELTQPTTGQTHRFEIIGTIENSSYILTFDKSGSFGVSSVEYFISLPRYQLIVPYDSERYLSIAKTEDENLLYMESSLAKILIFGDECPAEEVLDELRQYGHATYISDMLVNFDQSIIKEFVTSVIICIIFTLLTLVGVGGNNGIQNMLNEHEFIVYYMLGATQKQIVWIEAMRGGFIMLASFILAILLNVIFPNFYPLDMHRVTPATFFVAFLYLLAVYFSTSGVFLYKLSKKNLINTYKQRA